MNLLKESIQGHWLGSCTYEQALQEQERFYHSQPGLYLLGFETHHPTITLGRSANRESEVLTENSDFDVIVTDRGGQATLHSPGQLVLFPVMDLNHSDIRPRELVCQWLKFVYEKTHPFVGNDLETRDDGLYTPYGKLGFVGIRIRNKKVFHGLSLNVSNDLTGFEKIRSCGVSGANHDRIQRYNAKVEAKQVFEAFFQSEACLT